MNKYFIPFLLIASCFLTACREDFYVSDSAPAEAITLSVNDVGFVASDGTLSRSYDTDGTTVFEDGDIVGLIILDAKGNLLADNVPYIYDGLKWDFHTANNGGKQRVYYDAEMTNYIVYYPYTPTADNVKSVDELLALEIFKWQPDQSTEEAFRHCDVMMWTDKGPFKEIKAKMEHVRSSLSLDIKVNCTLTINDAQGNPINVTYHPKCLENDTITSFFEDFILYMGNKMILPYTYNAQETNGLARIRKEDGDYRYILPDNCDSTFSWRYYYNGKTYAGGFQASSKDKGIRYKHEEIFKMGELSGDKVLEGDYYCSKEVNNQLIGYVIPRDALELLTEHRCIGIVFKVGQEVSDSLRAYPDDVYPEMPGKCHGYVVALTNASSKALNWCTINAYAGTYMGTSARDDWNGYSNCQNVKEKAGKEFAYFPAIKQSMEYGSQDGLAAVVAPANSSGWYLPSIAQIIYINNQYKGQKYLNASINHVAAINEISEFNYIQGRKISLEFVSGSVYWSSSENVAENPCYGIHTNSGDRSKLLEYAALPVLSF